MARETGVRLLELGWEEAQMPPRPGTTTTLVVQAHKDTRERAQLHVLVSHSAFIPFHQPHPALSASSSKPPLHRSFKLGKPAFTLARGSFPLAS